MAKKKKLFTLDRKLEKRAFLIPGQRVVSPFSFKLYKVYPIGVSNYSKIVEIIRDFPKDDCTRSMSEKVDNAPGVDSPQYCAFARTLPSSPE